MRHVVNFSGGLCSFWAAHRVVQKYGTADVTLLFADTLIEDPDLYRFNEQASKILGVPITRVCDGRTPWQLFRERGCMGNSKHPICSIYLKREYLDLWHRENCLEIDSVIYVGMDWTEEHRLNRLRKKKPFWRFEAPMMDEPIWDKCRMIAEARDIGLVIPRAYELGFPHNNCGMRCVAAGKSHFAHLLKVLPSAFDEWEFEEAWTQAVFRQRGIDEYTILKEQRNGVIKPLSLRELRIKIESGERIGRHDWGGRGCGVQYL